MYTIIGGDGQQYGPASEADLRNWISEGRLSPQSLAKRESDAEFRPLGTFLEFADVFGSTAGNYGAPAQDLRSVDWSRRDYELDIGGCVSRAWNVFTNNLGILLGSTVLFILLVFIISAIVGAALNLIFFAFIPKEEAMQSPGFQIGRDLLLRIILSLGIGPLLGGLYHVFIQTIRGRPPGVGALFIGFQKAYAQLFLVYLVFSLVAAICFIPFTLVFINKVAPVIAQLQHFQNGAANPAQLHAVLVQMGTAFMGVIPVLCLCIIPAVYILINIQFALPLVIDKETDFWTAIKTSWRMVHKHWFTVFGLSLLSNIILMAGLFLCCVGCIFTFVISTAAILFGYETIFNDSHER